MGDGTAEMRQDQVTAPLSTSHVLLRVMGSHQRGKTGESVWKGHWGYLLRTDVWAKPRGRGTIFRVRNEKFLN